MRLKLSAILLIGLFTCTAVVSAEDAGAPAKVKKERTAKKKKVIRNKSAAKKSVPLGTVAPAPAVKPENKTAVNWIRELKKKLAKSQARQNQIVAVAAVRGNESPDSPPLYWKGKKNAGDVAMPEVAEFDAALDAALKGDPDQSVQALQAFVGKYPQSPLAEEAKGVIAKLEEPSGEPDPAQP